MKITRNRALQFLDYMMDPAVDQISNRLGPQTIQFHENNINWSTLDVICGYGFVTGDYNSIRKGQRHQTAVFYVDSDDNLAIARERIPRNLLFPGGYEEIRTQVVNVGSVTSSGFHNIGSRERARPAYPGCSLSHLNMQTGTLGLIVRCECPDDSLYILSSTHVLTEYGEFKPGDAIIQPGKNDGGNEDDKIGELYRACEIKYHDRHFSNTADAALARVIDIINVREPILNIGKHEGFNLQIRRDMDVKKSGRTSGVSYGKIRDPEARLRIPYPRGPQSTSKAGFRDVVLCSVFSQSGDSGAAVLNRNNEVVGLLMAGSNTATVFCKIGHVISELKIRNIS